MHSYLGRLGLFISGAEGSLCDAEGSLYDVEGSVLSDAEGSLLVTLNANSRSFSVAALYCATASWSNTPTEIRSA